MEILSIAVVVIVTVVILCYKHIPRHKITEELKCQIISNGLIHFTYYDNAIQIQKEGLVPRKKKAMYKCEKDMVWLYLNDEEQFCDQWEIIKGKGERKNYNAYVIVQNIEDNQIEQMHYRKSDMAIVHIGVLKTDNITVKKLDERVQ